MDDIFFYENTSRDMRDLFNSLDLILENKLNTYFWQDFNMELVDKEQYQNRIIQYNQRKLYIESEQFEIKVLHTLHYYPHNFFLHCVFYLKLFN